MSSLAQVRRLPLRLLVVGSAALLLITTLLVDVAWSHGSTIDPASRNYGCWKRWGSDFQNPDMAVQDPMCWQAWQADPNAMWNWNGLYIDGVAGDHQGAIPDGQLCSAGHTSDGRYAAMDTPGAWLATDVSSSFTVRVHDQALHGSDYHRVYVTRQGFNPLTDSLGWGDLELVAEIGAIPPGVGEPEDDPVLNGVTTSIDVNAPGRTGRHIVYTIWKAAHSDQTYYLCSDVRFSGGPQDPPPTTPPPTTPPPTTPPPTTPPPAGDGACAASYAVAGQWSGGFQADVRVTAGGAAINGWTVAMAFPDGQTISSMWNAAPGGSGSNVTATNMSYNGNLAAGQSAQFGFLGAWNGTANNPPSLTCTAT